MRERLCQRYTIIIVLAGYWRRFIFIRLSVKFKGGPSRSRRKKQSLKTKSKAAKYNIAYARHDIVVGVHTSKKVIGVSNRVGNQRSVYAVIR